MILTLGRPQLDLLYIWPLTRKQVFRPPSAPVFSTREVEGSWIHYGGGPRQCPGRYFAKRQILLTVALMVNLFDCEILGDRLNAKEDFSLHGFGGGVSHPASKIPMRIPRRTLDKFPLHVMTKAALENEKYRIQ